LKSYADYSSFLKIKANFYLKHLTLKEDYCVNLNSSHKIDLELFLLCKDVNALSKD
jgi:hypothetical protein